MTFTGRRRYRVHKSFFGKEVLVLQMEAEGSDRYGMRHLHWLDARVEWLTETVIANTPTE